MFYLQTYEGNAGLRNLEDVLEKIGYIGHQFKFGTPIEEFLSDNPGAIEVLVDWINENF